mmetsp:Transcript_29178/g.100651  ORF Transcript_29178/g.100651 Transcript_29178/m.100651 type:complete len:257 (+) Transcript_29178:71-841(+)
MGLDQRPEEAPLATRVLARRLAVTPPCKGPRAVPRNVLISKRALFVSAAPHHVRGRASHVPPARPSEKGPVQEASRRAVPLVYIPKPKARLLVQGHVGFIWDATSPRCAPMRRLGTRERPSTMPRWHEVSAGDLEARLYDPLEPAKGVGVRQEDHAANRLEGRLQGLLKDRLKFVSRPSREGRLWGRQFLSLRTVSKPSRGPSPRAFSEAASTSAVLLEAAKRPPRGSRTVSRLPYRAACRVQTHQTRRTASGCGR